MAYIAQVSIKSSGHIGHAIEYIERVEKALKLEEFKKELAVRLEHIQKIETASGERRTCLNCSETNTYKEFENTRRAFNQDKGVIAHHYYQSFQKDDNITPELAHKIGVELAKKVFPDYQVAIATHIDREHTHNHIIVNSCNVVTGQKWHSNKTSLQMIRDESDKLCRANGLGVIEKHSMYKGVDRTTYQLGLKGQSWKVQLTADLDKAVACCHSKEEFIKFLEKKNYSVKYRDEHITITKNGEKKGIRVDTLAKQFGAKFSKASLEKAMGILPSFSDVTIKDYQPKEKKNSKVSKSNWDYFEQSYFQKHNYISSTIDNIKLDERAERFSDIIEKSKLLTPALIHTIRKTLLFFFRIPQMREKKRKYKIVKSERIPLKDKPTTFGNISYYKLTGSSGNNLTVRVSIDKLFKLVNQPVLFSSIVDKEKGTATITVKEKDKAFLAKLLDMVEVENKLVEQSEQLTNQMTYRRLKDAAAYSNTSLKYMIVTKDELEKLKQNYIDFAFFKKDDKFNIAFLPETYELVRKILYKPKQQETPQQKNMRIYNQLKKSANESGEKLSYRMKISETQLKSLQDTNLEFAYFVNSEDKTKFNVAFEKKNEDAVKKILSENKKVQQL